MTTRILFVCLTTVMLLNTSVEAAKFGYLIVDVKDKSLSDTFYISRNKVRFDENNAVPIKADRNMYELSGGSYELLRKNKFESVDFDLVSKSLMSTKFKFKIKKDTVHFLGAIEIVDSGKQKFELKFNEDISLLKLACISHENIMSKNPIRFLNSNMPNKNFRFDCVNSSLSEW